MAWDERKIDRIQADVNEIKTHLAVYNEQLTIHIKRSDLLEKDMKERISPMEKKWTMVEGVLKLLGALAVIAEAIRIFR